MLRRVGLLCLLGGLILTTALSYRGHTRRPSHLRRAADAFAGRRFAQAAIHLRRVYPEEIDPAGVKRVPARPPARSLLGIPIPPIPGRPTPRAGGSTPGAGVPASRPGAVTPRPGASTHGSGSSTFGAATSPPGVRTSPPGSGTFTYRISGGPSSGGGTIIYHSGGSTYVAGPSTAILFSHGHETLRTALAAAEYGAGRPDRAIAVLEAGAAPGSATRAAERIRVIREGKPAEVFRALSGYGPAANPPRVTSASVMLSSQQPAVLLRVLLLHESIRLSPYNTADNLLLAHAIRSGARDRALPTAEALLQNVLKHDPYNIDALVGLGRVDEAVRLQPHNAELRRTRLRRAATHPGWERERITELETICRLDPKGCFGERDELVRLCVQLGDYERALQHLDRRGSTGTSSVGLQYLWVRGFLLAELGRTDEALRTYATAAARPLPSHASYLPSGHDALVGIAWLQAGDVVQARASFARVPSSSRLVELFAAWCDDHLIPAAGHLDRAMAEMDRGMSSSWSSSLGLGEQPLRQAERLLRAYPDCLPAVLLVARPLYFASNGRRTPEDARRLVALLEPFRRRFPRSRLVADPLVSALHTLGETERARAIQAELPPIRTRPAMPPAGAVRQARPASP